MTSSDILHPDAMVPRERGVAIVANDKITDWLLPFLESYVATNSTPIYLIPYNENMERTRRIAELYGATIADIDSRELDALAKRLYPLAPGKRHRLRKLLSVSLPLEEVLYIDVDVIVFRDLTEIFGHITPGQTDYIVISEATEYIYNKKRNEYPFLQNAVTFNDGFWLTSSKVLSIKDFYDVVRDHEKTFHAVRSRGGVYTQPLSNFVTHKKGLQIAPVSKLVANASGESFYKAEGVTFDADGPLDREGGRIFFAHWAGLVGLPTKRIFDSAWHKFSAKAAARVKAAGI